jgi:antitoxin ParD1/3/4
MIVVDGGFHGEWRRSRKAEKIVDRLVKSGRYNSRSEVLREGVRLVQEREARLATLDAAIARGIADAEAGRVKPQAFDRLEAEYRAPGASQAAMKVVVTDEAAADLDAIADWIGATIRDAR